MEMEGQVTKPSDQIDEVDELEDESKMDSDYVSVAGSVSNTENHILEEINEFLNDTYG